MTTKKKTKKQVPKKALLVGVNDYAPVGPGGPDLRGCVPDARDVAHTLNALGIVEAKPGTMCILTDARATRAAILEGLNWLVADAQSGDLRIFHYSGHGSQVMDIEDDEPDYKDETICPHDYASAGMIKDDDLGKVFAQLKEGVRLEVILDCCHSGSGTRDLNPGLGLCEASQVTYRYIEPPVDYGYFIDCSPRLPARRLLRNTPGSKPGARNIVPVAGMNHLVWAACRDDQTSAETSLEGTPRGVFTYCFCKVLRKAGAQIARDRLDALVSSDIKALKFDQVPQLEGPSASMGQPVFG